MTLVRGIHKIICAYILKSIELPLVGLQLALELANETRNQIPIKIVCITPEIRNIAQYLD